MDQSDFFYRISTILLDFALFLLFRFVEYAVKKKRNQHKHSLVIKAERNKNSGCVLSFHGKRSSLRNRSFEGTLYCDISHTFVEESKIGIFYIIEHIMNYRSL
jgi:hypothetical protein